MKKIIREVDLKKGIVQVTISDERWYLKQTTNPTTGLPEIKAVPSSTWIASHYPKGIEYFKWLANKGWDEAEAIKSAAGGRGSKVHNAIESIFKGEEVRIDSKFMNPQTEQQEELTLEEVDCVLSFLAWYEEEKPEVICYEINVFSDKYGYAGTIDLVCKIRGVLWVIDFKTSQFIWPSHRIQVSSYGKIIETGEHDIPAIPTPDTSYFQKPKLGILQLGYRMNKKKFKFTELEDKFDLFLAAKQIWAEETSGQSISKKDYPIVLSPGKPREEVTAPVQETQVAQKTEDDIRLKAILDLEGEIAYDQQQYDLAVEHPTDTAQFRNALAKSAKKLEEKKAKLETLKNKTTK